MTPLPDLYLASKSPRRAQLLESLGLPFKILFSETPEENPTWENVEAVTRKNARVKAETAFSKMGDVTGVVIGADTLVVLGKEILGKPKDRADAKVILKKLSGQKQIVVTGLAVLSKKEGCRESNVQSAVYFKKLTDKQIEEYISTTEPYDKAGAYAVQGLGALFIEKIEGSYTNVMGLPIEKLLEELSSLTKIEPYQWFPRK